MDLAMRVLLRQLIGSLELATSTIVLDGLHISKHTFAKRVFVYEPRFNNMQQMFKTTNLSIKWAQPGGFKTSPLGSYSGSLKSRLAL